MKFFNLKNLMASGRQCGVAFIIAAVIHGFLAIGPAVGVDCPAIDAPAVEALIIGVGGFAMVFAGSIQLPGGNS